MTVQIRWLRRTPGLKSKTVKSKLERVLRDSGFPKGEVSILFTDDQHIAELNRRYRGKSGPTNVLAFPMRDESEPVLSSEILGDVVISVDTAIAESVDLSEPLEETILRLLVHGILHLLGYDHERSSGEASRMTREQNRILGLVRG
jgi:rRNA maturation RNase YbeY